jgi:glycosyltransferase involved in cell wall biosynthesis
MPRPLTILQVTSSENRSGGTRQAMLLCEGLRDAGHRVVFCAPGGSPALTWARGEGFETWETSTGRIRTQWRVSRKLRAVAKAVGADVVHAHHTEGHNVALLATFGGGFPPVVANRGVVFRPEFPPKFRTSRTRAVITNSEAAKRVLQQVGVNAAKIHVVYNAKEPPDLTALGRSSARLREEFGIVGAGPLIGAVGSGKPDKGFQHLVAAAPEILRRFPDARFVLVGGHADKLRPQIEELALTERFLLPGHRADATDIMGLFDVFVLPSLFESCPNVLLEAMGVGVPAVGSNVGGVSELLEGGRIGRLVAPGDPQAIASEVCGLLEDPAGAQHLGQAAREALSRRFSVRNKAQATLAVYERVLRSVD